METAPIRPIKRGQNQPGSRSVGHFVIPVPVFYRESSPPGSGQRTVQDGSFAEVVWSDTNTGALRPLRPTRHMWLEDMVHNENGGDRADSARHAAASHSSGPTMTPSGRGSNPSSPPSDT